MKRNCVLLGLMALMFAACTQKRNENRAMELRFGLTAEPSTLDPLNPANTADGR